jgi:HD-like signal output (HDOD) protein
MATEHPASVIRLLTAIQTSGDFPAMANTVDVIGSMTSSESTSSGALAEIILQDFGLTQKLLRLVNTLAYSQYGQVTTITRAVLLMGFDRIRSLATSLIIFEHFRKQAGSGRLSHVLNKAFYSAVIGRTIAQDTGFADGEEAFISTLFHRLGEILVAFYLPTEYATIEAAPAADRERVTQEVLGLSFQGVGVAVAEALKMPDALRHSMTAVKSDDLSRTLGASERLSCLATLANAMVDTLAAPGSVEARREGIQRLAIAYGRQVAILDKVDVLISKTVKEVKNASSTFKLNTGGTSLSASLVAWGLSEHGVTSAVEKVEPKTAAAVAEEVADAAVQSEPPETILDRGLDEVTALLISEFALDDLLRVAMETIYRALGVGKTRVLFLLKDPSGQSVKYRFGFGLPADEIDLWNEVKITGGEDVFSQAVAKGRDLVIRNARVPAVAYSMPSWMTRRGVLDRYLVLLPLTVGTSRVGTFYIDGDKAKASVLLTPSFVDKLKILRDHVVLAIVQRANRKT